MVEWFSNCALLFLPSLCSKTIHALALIYVVYTAVVFNLPTLFPVTVDNFNYNPIGVGIFILIFVGWWVIDARRWFKGPANVHETNDGDGDEAAKPASGMGRLFQ